MNVKLQEVTVKLAHLGNREYMHNLSSDILFTIQRTFPGTRNASVSAMPQYQLETLPAALPGMPYHVRVVGHGDTISAHREVCGIVSEAIQRHQLDADVIEVSGRVKIETPSIPAWLDQPGDDPGAGKGA